MVGEHHTHTAFDEQAATEKLERLRQAVEQSRKRRKDLSDEFDAFVDSFKRDRSGVTIDPPAPAVEEKHSVVRSYDESMPYVPRAAAARRPVPRSSALVGALAVVAVGVLVTRAWRDSPTERPATTAAQPPAPDGGVRGSAPPSDVQPIPGMVQGELTAVRRVWVRATVDGERLVERELQANERVPLRPARTLVIRVGDGGALRVAIDGRDRGLLGASGTIVTRTFTAATSAPR